MLVFLSEMSIYFPIMLSAAVVHELGHIAAIKLLARQKFTFTLYPFGADISYNSTNVSYTKETVISLSGCGANLIFALIGTLLIKTVYSREMMFFVFSNFAYAAINIFPIKSLDGGKALENILLGFLDTGNALRIAEIVSSAAFTVMTFFALVVLSATGYNFSLLMMCLYLFITVYIKENLNYSK